jgi:ferrous iron transport protein A
MPDIKVASGVTEFSVIPLAASVIRGAALALGQAQCGFRGRVEGIRASDTAPDRAATELEMRLIEIGFVEGARVEILHEGAFGRDPIAVRVNDSTIALRRKEAMAVFVHPLDDNS